MDQSDNFFDLYNHGFARVAVGVPAIRVADPAWNGAQTARLMAQAAQAGTALMVFPELGLSGYTCDDLFHQHALLDACEAALLDLVEASKALDLVAVVGLPWRVDQRLFNCAAVVQRGRLLGLVPKTYLPNYAEFYEARQFNPASTALPTEVKVGGQTVPFGSHLLFQCEDLPRLVFHVEICEDVWVPIPPSSYAALAGATVLLNLSASNITVGKADYRHRLVSSQSARCLAAYLYSSAGAGESSTDLAWDGQSLICENGELLAESERFSSDSHLITADVDLEKLSHERMRQTSFGQSAELHREPLSRFRTVTFGLHLASSGPRPLQRHIERFPYVPSDPRRRDERCHEVYSIQVQALVQRLSVAGHGKLVIGVSGGLDSTHALLVCAKALDLLGRPRSDILGVTMPGFATSTRTLDQALRLMEAVGCSVLQIDIRPSCQQMLKDIGHAHAPEAPVYDVTFENVQAGERTSHLFRLANLHQGIVVGTGDLSELALGWCTYGVGDHMSHYNVNASVPKTLIKHLVRWVADTRQVGEQGSEVLHAIVDTEISPELVPGQGDQDQPGQSTESVIGPYELQDFHLFQMVRYGFPPSKVAFLAYSAWLGHDKYTLADIKKHLRVFLQRFFTNQFKRSCVPNSPKVGSGGSLSPRGDWRAPSDARATTWLAELDSKVPDQDAA
ncbi:NAD(+) synthase [Aquabacterium sp. CECT 9606]|uniref:NAD(+) synthase n=1 Tax=Aquabacterium sp. CECT 9606 TaxID=2845822 RepID=UPI001E4A7F39|nr:NAD(+) synthase [Aquabacterium sp. CECT 9606]CAH0351971.1 Glutamine-dependent NAD(+) synthetase [Aquabacterium sp. CECT 9606]